MRPYGFSNTDSYAFALSGMRHVSRKQIDWFGAFIIGLTTAIGGGTVRDLLLDITPFWFTDSRYFIITGSFGGVLRDVHLNEVPLLFRKDIYALACVLGGVVYFICNSFTLHRGATELIAVATLSSSG